MSSPPGRKRSSHGARAMSRNATSTQKNPMPTTAPERNQIHAHDELALHGSGVSGRALIMTARGEIAAEQLCHEDLVLSLSGSLQPIRKLSRLELPGVDPVRPSQSVRIKANALSTRSPVRDLIVGPKQQLLVDGLLVEARYLVIERSIVLQEDIESAVRVQLALHNQDAFWLEGAAVASMTEIDVQTAEITPVQERRAGLGTQLDPARTPLRRFETCLNPDPIRRRLTGRSTLYAEIPANAFRGAIEYVGFDRITGWAVNDAKPHVPVGLDLLIDGVPVLQFFANQSTQKISGRQSLSGYHGFSVRPPKGAHGHVDIRCTSTRKLLPRLIPHEVQ